MFCCEIYLHAKSSISLTIHQLGLVGTAVLMMKTQIGLGVLSIPSAFNVLGMVPGVICLCVIGFITSWSGYIVGKFKLHHPEVYGVNDVGALIFGQLGRWFLAITFCLCMSPRPCP